MQTEKQRRDIFECNIPPCNTTPRKEQFKIWEDGYRVGYIYGTDDVKNNCEYTSNLKEKRPKEVSCLECAYFDEKNSACDHEDGGPLSNPAKIFCQNFKKPEPIGKLNDGFYYCGKCGCGGKNWNLYNFCPICGVPKECVVNE